MKFTKREFLSSLAASTFLATSTEAQQACFVTRGQQGSFTTKSYRCTLGQDQQLTVTFMRISDLLFDVARSGRNPRWMPQHIEDIVFVENEPLTALMGLFSRFSYRFEHQYPRYTFDGRDGRPIEVSPGYSSDFSARDVVPIRTLGVWNAPFQPPTFPSPQELRNLGRPAEWNAPQDVRFIRYANEDDFRGLNEKVGQYSRMLASVSRNDSFGERYYPTNMNPNYMDSVERLDRIGHLPLMQYLGAGSASRFLPIFSVNRPGECGDVNAGFGIFYDPPALFVDIAIFHNTGTTPILIDDVLGETEGGNYLSTYSSSVATGQEPLGVGPTRLAAGQRTALVQRLLFQTLDSEIPEFGARPAVYGKTELPTGIRTNGRNITFDGRSHNALVLTSAMPELSCPFLEYWCPDDEEWINVGSILGHCEGRDNQSIEAVKLSRFTDRLRIVERESETSMIKSVRMRITLDDGTELALRPKTVRSPNACKFPIRIEYSEAIELSFIFPEKYSASDVAECDILIEGYYTKAGALVSSDS